MWLDLTDNNNGKCLDCGCKINEEPHSEICDFLWESWNKRMRDAHRDWLDAKATVARFRHSRVTAGRAT